MTATLNLLESAAYRTATSETRKVYEAFRLVAEGANGNKVARAQLSEAVTTHDFPRLLSKGIEDEVTKRMQTVENETAQLARVHQTRDFREVKYRELFLSAAPMKQVLETEEYKSRDPFSETHIRLRTAKFGRRYGMSWEAITNDEWNQLLDLPQLIVQEATATRNHLVFSQLVGEDGAFSSSFFPQVSDAALTHENVKAARKELLRRRFRVGTWDQPADFSSQILLVTQSQADEAQAIVGAGTITEIRGTANNRIEREVANPLRGLTVVVSDTLFQKLAPGVRDTAWALLPAASTRNPALVRAVLRGHPDVEVRYKNDTGNYVGGGAVPHTEGNYGNDTIDFRGRITDGAATAFNYGVFDVDEETGAITNREEPLVYASTGTAEA